MVRQYGNHWPDRKPRNRRIRGCDVSRMDNAACGDLNETTEPALYTRITVSRDSSKGAAHFAAGWPCERGQIHETQLTPQRDSQLLLVA